MSKNNINDCFEALRKVQISAGIAAANKPLVSIPGSLGKMTQQITAQYNISPKDGEEVRRHADAALRGVVALATGNSSKSLLENIKALAQKPLASPGEGSPQLNQGKPPPALKLPKP